NAKVSVLLNTTAPGATTASFAASQTFAVGNAAEGGTLADINGDGRPDLITTNHTDNTISVLLNQTAAGATTPSFGGQQTFATGRILTRFGTAADFNGDGRPDVALANSTNPGTLSVLFNTTPIIAASASFSAQRTFAIGSAAVSGTVAD